MTRVFIVDDSSFSRKLLRRVIGPHSDLEVVGEADSGREALELLAAQPVDVVTLDVNLPDINGLLVLKEIRARFPSISVLMLSALTHEGARTTVEALTLGAVDFIDKTQFGSFDVAQLGGELLGKLRAIGLRQAGPASVVKPPAHEPQTLITRFRESELCVVGASTGGPSAVQQLLQALAAPPPFPLVISQHMPQGFTREFARRLGAMCACEVREAQADEFLANGVAYISPGGRHLSITRQMRVTLSDALDSSIASPSVDDLFSSAAELTARVCGVLLTGMGRDGAVGLARVRKRGGLTIAQDAASCVVYGMPRTAVEIGAVEHVLALDEIAKLFRDVNR